MLVCLIVTLCAVSFSTNTQAQTASPSAVAPQSARVVERLPDGDLILEVGGVEYRAITAEHARRLASERVEYTACAAERANLEQQAAHAENAALLSNKDKQLAETQLALERERSLKHLTMYQAERDLRLQADSLVERSRSSGRVSKFFDNPFVQVGTKLGFPALQSWIAASRC